MKTSTKTPSMQELAARGAQARLQDHLGEIRQLVGMFPELKTSEQLQQLTMLGRHTIPQQATAQPIAPQTRTLTKAARRAISQAQKKRWAAHRKAKASSK